MTPREIVGAMSLEDERAVLAVREALDQVAVAVEWAVESLERGGRIVYFGAGTSGRLGVLDAAECPPTFGVSPDVVVGVIAGGAAALTQAIEGVEDDPDQCARDLDSIGLGASDLAIGLAASGRTPYVVGGLRHARALGCRTVAIACNAGSAIGREADLAIEAATGPEVLTGSTRLKAGTAEKMMLNMISTASMVGVGKAYQNLMVDVRQANEKLCARARGIVMEATGVSAEEAGRALARADGSAKVAIVMLLAGLTSEQAAARLAEAHGRVRDAIEVRR